jgi:hypothetical protein
MRYLNNIDHRLAGLGLLHTITDGIITQLNGGVLPNGYRAMKGGAGSAWILDTNDGIAMRQIGTLTITNDGGDIVLDTAGTHDDDDARDFILSLIASLTA